MRHTAETKKKLSDMRKGEKNPFYGGKHSEEWKRKQSERTKLLNSKRQYKCQPQKIKTPHGLVAAYLAGMIDADGSVRFKKGRPFVSIYNTNKDLINWLVKTLGHGHVSFGNQGREQVLAWTIGGARDVYALLIAIRPLLIVKASDADLVIKFIKGKYQWAN